MIKNLIPVLFSALLFSCMPGFKLDRAFHASPRISYEKKVIRHAPALQGWSLAHENALAAPRNISLPHGGNGIFKDAEFPVYSYRFDLQAGEVLDVKVLTDTTTILFIDLYSPDSAAESIHSNSENEGSMAFTAKETAAYVLTIQPEAGANAHCQVLLNKGPLYAFPVAGKGNSAIQSFWEAPRDGGKRRHEGIDIFAKRGTPVVAVTDGTISDTGDRGLGGKQVWQRAGLFGNSIYYAHLDAIAVVAGQSVKTGDTLGFVGNTGNAKGGPTHLHFGIYEGWQGAINPLPFVYRPKQIAVADLPKTSQRRSKVKR